MENTNENMSIHRGEFIKARIKESGVSIKKISEETKTSRTSLYIWFSKPKLSSSKMIILAKAINYNVFADFPEMKDYNEEFDVDIDNIVDTKYKQKYFSLMEQHIKMRNDYDEILKKKE